MTKSATQQSAKRWAAPDSLSDAIDMLADLRATVEDLEQQVESISEDSDKHEERANIAEGRAEDAETALYGSTEELACIRIKLKAGRIDEAIYDLDRVLQELDGDCKARMSAVAVML